MKNYYFTNYRNIKIIHIVLEVCIQHSYFSSERIDLLEHNFEFFRSNLKPRVISWLVRNIIPLILQKLDRLEEKKHLKLD